ncbi:MAG TPA: hypothetical protein VFC63_07585 [Blastocatellia bacterium]|nr:hypothetical protein [Blastocatellia bacterium]
MASKRQLLIKELNFWLSIITDSVGVGKSKLPTGKKVTDAQRLEYIAQRLQSAGAKTLRESIESDQADFPANAPVRHQLGD